MARYEPSFNRTAKGKFNPLLNFVSIKGGTNAYILEDEFNESQWIQNEKLADIIRKMTYSGSLDIDDDINSPEMGGYQELGVGHLNAFKLNAFVGILNGYMSIISDETNDGQIVQLPYPPETGTRNDFVYLEFWFQELKQYDSVVTYGGLKNPVIGYEIIDSRLNYETSRRVQLQWAVRVAADVNPDNFPVGFVDKNDISNINVNPQGSHIKPFTSNCFRRSSTDPFLFYSKDMNGEFNTVDGFIYAIPLVTVKRLNNNGFHTKYNPNGGVDYVDTSSLPGRPDNKFANVIYFDQIKDLRHLATIGYDQYKKLFASLDDFNAYKEYVYVNIETPLGNLIQQVNDLTLDFVNFKEYTIDRFNLVDNNIAKNKSDIQILRNDFEAFKVTINDKVDNCFNSLQLDLNNLKNNIAIQNALYDSEIADLYRLFNSMNNVLLTTVSKVNNINDRLTWIEKIMNKSGHLSDVIYYGIDMYRKSAMTLGGQLQSDGTIACSGIVFDGFNYGTHNDYVALATMNGIPEGKTGDIWFEKGDTSCLIKNTGSDSLQCDVFIMKIDNYKIHTGVSTFNGSTGVKIPYIIDNNSFVYISPLQNYKGEIGEIYLTKLSDGFMVYNTGSAGNTFDWIVIDTAKLNSLNIEFGTIALNGLTGVAKSGPYGDVSEYQVIASTPFTPIADYGGIGDITINRGMNTFTAYCSGEQEGIIQYLAFKKVDTTQIQE